jgi:GNAT superfamily N-acetyltransferase
MADEIVFNEDENSWLLTLPEMRSGGQYFPVCRIVAVRTLKETYCPASDDIDSKKQLTARTCTIALFWDGGGWHQEPRYKAEYRVNTWNGKTELDLTNSDFMLDYKLRGRGLGSWLMQQLISWAKTLPPDTSVKPIKTSPVDEDDRTNMLRRDRFWYGIGFRFPLGERQSLPLRVSDLISPEGCHYPLMAVPLHKGVDELNRQCERQKLEIENLKSGKEYQAQQIGYLTKRQWDVLLINFTLSALFSPFLILCWLYRKVKGNREIADENRPTDEPDE